MAQETRSVSVSPQQEQNEINIWQDFGWTLQSSQQVFNKDSHLESHGDTVYSVTDTTNFVKLVFTRNTSMPNYSEICALEQEFDGLQEHRIPGPFFNFRWLLFSLVWGLGLVVFIALKLINRKKKKAAIEHNEYVHQRRAELREQARALLD